MIGHQLQTTVAMVILMLRSFLLLFLCVKNAYPVEKTYVPVGSTVTLYFVIPSRYKGPNNEVFVGHMQLEKFDHVFAYRPEGPQWRVMHKYLNRLTYTVYNSNLLITLSLVEPGDSGVYLCHDLSARPLEGCENSLVVLGKPFRPHIYASQVAVEGQQVSLRCNHHTSLHEHNTPPDFVVVSWNYKNMRTREDTAVEMGEFKESNATLSFSAVKRTYKDMFITCTTKDIFPKYTGSDPLPVSDPSTYYYFNPEFPPNPKMDIKIWPRTVRGTETIDRSESDIIRYQCDITCNPPCVVYWSFKSDNSDSYTNLTMKDSHILRKRLDKESQGTYRCTGANKHGEASWSINVRVSLLEPIEVRINGILEDTDALLEHRPLTLTCSTSFITEKSPVISWKSHNETVLSEGNLIPTVIVNKEGHHYYKFTSAFSMQTSDCGAPMDYTCVIDRDDDLHEHSIHVNVICQPSIYKDVDLKLLPEYEATLTDALAFAFIVRGVPEPTLNKVISSLNGEEKCPQCKCKTSLQVLLEEYFTTNNIYTIQLVFKAERLETLDTDVSVIKESNYDGKHYLTKFIFTTLKQLDYKDFGRNYTMHFVAGNFTEAFSFVVKTPTTTPPEATSPMIGSLTNDIYTPRQHPHNDNQGRNGPALSHDGQILFLIISCVIFAVVLVVAVVVLLKQKRAVSAIPAAKEKAIITENEKKELKEISASKTSQKASRSALSPVTAGESKIF